MAKEIGILKHMYSYLIPSACISIIFPKLSQVVHIVFSWQVLVFYGCGKEKCAMVRNEDGCGLSLPVNHTHKFHVVPGVKTETSVKKESGNFHIINA